MDCEVLMICTHKVEREKIAQIMIADLELNCVTLYVGGFSNSSDTFQN